MLNCNFGDNSENQRIEFVYNAQKGAAGMDGLPGVSCLIIVYIHQ